MVGGHRGFGRKEGKVGYERRKPAENSGERREDI